MKFYPVFLNIQHAPVLVVGGGRVATRKVLGLLPYKPILTVIAPKVSDEISALARADQLSWLARRVEEKDLDGQVLVFIATNDDRVNRRMAYAARTRGILSNVADSPEECDFIVPAVIHKGEVSVAVSTQGLAPGVAKALKKYLGPLIGEQWSRKVAATRRRRFKANRRSTWHAEKDVDSPVKSMMNRLPRRGRNLLENRKS